jgi:ERCC4-related helicase
VLRQYQKEIVEKCANKNTIFTLPTGAGKTAVAAELIRIRIESTRLKAVLFVPTTTLLKQQQHEMKLWLSNEYEVKVLKGGDAYPKEFGVLISTAEAFNNALINRESHAINEFCIMVFDEVHHCKDSHAYSRVMETIKSEMERANVQSPVRFVGMSASLTYEITPKGVAASIEHLKRALNVEKLVTYDIEQLVNMGYKPNERKLLCDFRCVPHNAKAIPVGDRRTDVRSAIYRRIQDRTATPLTLLVYEIVMKVEESCKIVFDDYMELKAETNVSEWPRRATMMVERAKSDSQRSCSRQMEIWWKAFYLLTITWEDKEHLIVHWIKMHQDTYKSDIKSKATRELINDVMRHKQCTLDGHTMFDVLVNKIMSTQTTLTTNGVKMKGLIFVANKLEGLIVADYLASDKDMKSIGIKTKFVAAPKSSSVVKLSKTSVNQTLKDYECGELDLLVTTTLLEEGFNDKGVNAIINLSSIDHTVSLEQRLGRARGQDSSLHLLVEHPNRSINAISDSLRLQKKYISEPMPEVIEARAKQSREAKLKSADEYLSRQTVEQMRREPKAILNAYMAKSNMMVDREIVQTALSNEGMYKVTLTVRSLNLAVEAVGRTKRNTESEAAFEMLREVKSLKLLR